MQFAFKGKVVSGALLVSIILNVSAAFFFTRIDTVVNTDLYNFGLRFDPGWAEKYRIYLDTILSLFLVSTIIAIFALVLVVLSSSRRDLRPVSCLLLVVSTAITILPMFMFLNLDKVVHVDLYRYGLQFSDLWADKYWMYAWLMLSMQIASVIAASASIALVALSIPSRIDVHSTKLVRITMFAAGAASLAISVFYNSSILAFVGLGLLFWAAILSYVQNEDYAKQTILEATAASASSTLNQMITRLNYNGQAIYLPPQYLKNPETSKVLILKRKDSRIPTPQQFQDQEDQPLNAEAPTLLITPPGAELAKLFEKTLNTSFTKLDLQYVQQILPKLFIEDLEIAENVKIDTAKNTVQVTLENSVFRDSPTEANTADDSHLGSLIASAVACVLAKATGKPVTIAKEQTSQNGKRISIEYRLLVGSEEEPPQ